ncbi:MAG: BON domain-containing protein [Gemmatimonadaceae bacterium]|nr:BON domain-containing protein [Gemmatimonadaceae bacterium]
MPRIVTRQDDAHDNTGLYVLAAALGGMAAGYLLATRAGGIAGLRRRLRDLLADEGTLPEAAHAAHEDDYEDADDDSPWGALEDRVLAAFENDPVLAHRAVDITATGPDVVELTGWVRREQELEHAVTIARGTPGVQHVRSRLSVRRAVGAR